MIMTRSDTVVTMLTSQIPQHNNNAINSDVKKFLSSFLAMQIYAAGYI